MRSEVMDYLVLLGLDRVVEYLTLQDICLLREQTPSRTLGGKAMNMCLKT